MGGGAGWAAKRVQGPSQVLPSELKRGIGVFRVNHVSLSSINGTLIACSHFPIGLKHTIGLKHIVSLYHNVTPQFTREYRQRRGAQRYRRHRYRGYRDRGTGIQRVQERSLQFYDFMCPGWCRGIHEGTAVFPKPPTPGHVLMAHAIGEAGLEPAGEQGSKTQVANVKFEVGNLRSEGLVNMRQSSFS